MTSNVTEVDHKVLAELVYLDIPEGSSLYRSYKRGNLTVGELVNFHKESPEELEKLRDRFSSDGDFEQFKATTIELSRDSSKYYDWKINHVENHNPTTGFVGYTFEPKEGAAIVAFRGSEDMAKPEHMNTDWKNNASLAYAEFAVQQIEATNYLNNIGGSYQSISVTGHSLGGNDALSGSVLADDAIRDKIWAVRTYNAPGFNKEFLNSNEDSIDEMKDRIQEFQNEDDIVSSIFYNLTTPIIIETNMKGSSGVKGLLDPLLKLTDAHALHHMSQLGEDGLLKRKDNQMKNFTCLFMENLTKGAQMLPDTLLKGFTETVFAYINGRVNLGNILKAGVVLAALSPVASFAVAAFTIKTLITAVVTVFVVTLAVTVGEIVYQAVQDFTRRLHQEVVAYMDQLFAQMVVSGIRFAIDINKFRKLVYEEVGSFFGGLGRSISKWWNSLGGTVYAEIRANTGSLRNIAGRLSGIQNKIYSVDSRLNTLRGLVEIEDKLGIVWLDMKVGYDYELRQCISYLHKAAEELEQAEQKIIAKAGAF